MGAEPAQSKRVRPTMHTSRVDETCGEERREKDLKEDEEEAMVLSKPR